MTDATTSTLSVRIETGQAASDLLALQKGLEGAATGVRALGREIQNHAGNINKVLNELSRYSFAGLSHSLDQESGKLKTSMDKLEEQAGKSGREAGRKYASNFSVAMADGTKVSFKAVGDSLLNLTSKVSAEGVAMLSQFKAAGLQTKEELRKAAAEAITQERNLKAFRVGIADQKIAELGAYEAKEKVFREGILAQKLAQLAENEVKEKAFREGILAQKMSELAAHEAKVKAFREGIFAQKMSQLAEDAAREKAFREGILAQKLAEIDREERAMAARRAQYVGRTGTLGGYATALNTAPISSFRATVEATAALEKQRAAAANLTPALNESGKAMSNWSDEARVLHDTARGAAAGVGYLWMTWGNIGAMAAGFTAVRGMISSLKEMAEVEVLLTKASREAGMGFDDMRDRIMSMYTDGVMPMVHGPKEVAEQLKNLVYAGFEASEAFDILGVSLKFAEVGELDAAEAAQVLQQTIHAFGLTGQDAGRVADVLAKAAAASATDVGAMSAAMKQAVAVGALYNASIEDTATSLAVLAKAGIEGSAAGTSLKRFMDELASPKTNKAKEAIEALGVQVFEFENGVRKLKGLGEIVDEMRDKFQQLSQVDAKAFYDLVDRMQDERGKKFFSLAVKMTQAEWDAFKSTVEKDATGFVGSMYRALSETTAGLFKQTGAQLRASLQEALQGVDDAAKQLGRTLLQAVSSQEFKTFLTQSLSLLASLTTAITEHAEGLTRLLTLYAGFKAVSVALHVVATAYVRLSSAVAAAQAGQLLLAASFLKGVTKANRAAAATAGVAVAANKAKTAIGALMLAMRANPIFAMLSVVSSLAAAYITLRDNTNGAASAARKAQTESENTIRALKAETEETWNLVRAKERELGLRQSEREESKELNLAKKESLEDEIKRLSADPKTQKGQEVLADFAKGNRGKLTMNLFYGEEIAKARRLEAAKGELYQIRKLLFEQELASARLRSLNARSEQGSQTPGTPGDIPVLGDTGGAKAMGSTEAALKNMTDSLRRYTEEQEYSIATGVKMTSGMKLLVKAYDMLGAAQVGTGKGRRALTEAEKEALRSGIAVVEQNELRLAQEENRQIQAEAYMKSVADQVQHEQNLLNVRAQSGEITRAAAATLSDLYTARERDKAVMAEFAAIEELSIKRQAALAAGSEALAQRILNEMDRRSHNIAAMRQEAAQLEEINKVRANADWNKWNKEHGENVRKINESVAAYMREKGAILSLTQATKEEIKAAEFAREVKEKYVSEILKVENEMLEEQLTWKTLLAELDKTTDEGARQRLIDDIETSLKKWGALTDQMGDLKRAQDAAADSAAKLGAEVAKAEDWQSAYQNISRSLEDGIIEGIHNGFSNGRDLLDSFKDTLKNEFNNLILRPIIQPIAQYGAYMVMGMMGMGASGTAMAGGTGDAGNILSLGSLLTSTMAPGAISTGAGVVVGGIAESLGASSAFAGSLGAAVATALPWIGAIAAIGSAFGLFGGKPSNKSAWGEVDLASGEISGLGNMTGKKQASQETMDARDLMLAAVGGFGQLLYALGATNLPEKTFVEVGERDGIRIGDTYYGSDPNAALVGYFRDLSAEADGLDSSLKSLLVNFNGTAEEFGSFTTALITLQEYAAADPLSDMLDALAGSTRSLFQNWQAGETSARDLASAFDGSLASAQSLAAAVQAQYQIELQLLDQIQQALNATTAMFDNSIEQVKLSVMTESDKYDYYRSKTDEAYALLQTAMDPVEIERQSRLVHDYTMAAWGMLDESQKQEHADEYISYLESTDQLTRDRFEAATELVTSSHEDLATTIKDVMQDVADALKEAAQTPQQVQVTVDVNVDTPADVEVGYHLRQLG